MHRTLLCLPLALTCACSRERAASQTTCFTDPPSTAVPAGQEGLFPDSLFLTIGQRHYVLHTDGSAATVDSGAQITFQVPLPDSTEHLEHAYALGFNCDLVVIAEYSDGESGGASVYRISRDSLRSRWVTRGLAFNVAEPLLDPPYLYLAAFSTVAKIDLNTGTFLWRHDDLYDRSTQAFNVFQRPELRGDTVVFPSGGRNILVQRASGEIIAR